MNVGGLSEPLPLISKEKKKDLTKCIICENSKYKKGDSKLTSTEAGRNVIRDRTLSM